MISIKISQGVPYIWDPKEWLALRKEHRIVGVLDGPVGNGLSGRIRWNLPMRLTQVEVQYLLSRGIAQTVVAPILFDENPSVDPETLRTVVEQRKSEQLDDFKKKRKEEFVVYLDKLLEGKRRKGRIGEITDKDAFVQNELDKITKTPYEMYQLDLKDPWTKKEDYLPFDFPIPTTYVERLKLRVFEDFHLHKKYWLSPGDKFGGDFLAYPGDPRHFHAEFIIMCLDKKILFDDFIVSQCRLAMTVKKTLLIASLDEHNENLMYYVPKKPNSTKTSD